MADLSKAMSLLQAFRRKFETLLAAARAKVDRAAEAPAASPAKRLREVMGFGSNPGNLRMFVHVPERLSRDAPLVVALHGCSQTADDYDYGAGWSSLADRLGFAVVYPQQQPANNPQNCFSWFSPGDIARDHGESLSIRQMVEHAIASFGLDRRRIFVTGLSAGGAMASVMLATYPEVFAGGAIIAGLPYGCARTVQQAFEAMFTEQASDALALGDRVRAASQHRGPWPKISIWHGTADPIVKPSNSEAVIRQWTDVHGISATPSYEESIGSHRRRVWSGADGEALIEAFSISGMAHGVPLAMTMGEESCGAVGAFFLDAGISSIHHIARFWRIGEDLAEKSGASAMAPEPHRSSAQRVAVVTAEQAGRGPGNAEETSFGPEQDARRRSYDPNHVIAAAFKAAGLPVPEIPNRPSGVATHVDPGPIIEAALKAAGLPSSARSSADR